jgi:hypothetical protein
MPAALTILSLKPGKEQKLDTHRESWGSHGGEYKVYSLLGNCVAECRKIRLTVERCLLPPCLGKLGRLDDGGRMHFWKLCLLIREYTAQCPRRLSSSWTSILCGDIWWSDSVGWRKSPPPRLSIFQDTTQSSLSLMKVALCLSSATLINL